MIDIEPSSGTTGAVIKGADLRGLDSAITTSIRSRQGPRSFRVLQAKEGAYRALSPRVRATIASRIASRQSGGMPVTAF